MKKYLLIIVFTFLIVPSTLSAQTAGERPKQSLTVTSQSSFASLYAEAKENYSNGQFDVAAGLLERAVLLEPKNAEARYRLGSCYYELENYKKAIESYRIAISLQPDHYDAVVYLGNSLDYDGQFEKAVEMYRKAIQLKPDQWQPHYELGIAQYNQKLFSDAAVSFQETIKRGQSIEDERRNETISRSYYFLGDSHRLSKRYSEAIKAFQEAIKIDETAELAIYGLGMSYVGVGNSAGARQQYEKLREVNRDLAAQLLAEINKIQIAA